MLLKFIKLCIIFIIIGVSIIVYNRPELRSKMNFSLLASIPKIKDVKGIDTQKGATISSQIKKDINKNFKEAQINFLNLRIIDLINTASKSGKIVKDFKNFQDYLKEQISNVAKFNQ